MRRSLRSSLLLSALTEFALGLVLLLWPENCQRFLCIAAGVVCILVALYRGFSYYKNEQNPDVAVPYHRALVLLLIGLLLIIRSTTVLTIFGTVMGLIILAGSISKLQLALQLRRSGYPHSTAYAIIAAVLIAFGIALLFDPFSGATFVTICIGILMEADAICGFWAYILFREERSAERRILR